MLSCGCADTARIPDATLPPVPVTGQQAAVVKPAAPEADTASIMLPTILDTTSQSVVGISTLGVSKSQLVEGLGTGVIVHADGWVLTNEHVAGNVARLTVVFADGTRMEGTTVWSDKALDLAVVRLHNETPQSFPAAELCTDALFVGQTVYAIGTPLGMQFQHTVTQGIVSALGRTLQLPGEVNDMFMEELIQTDASINPGNSGGPLIDAQGRVVGINTLKVTEAEGLGFAIPIAVALPVLNHILQDGAYETPYLGLYGYDDRLASYMNATRDGGEKGVKITQVDSGGPATGLQVGDLVIAANGEPITTMLALRLQLYRCRIGDAFLVTVQRGNETLTIDVRLAARPRLP